jgi:GNAT superfamily N-acetyltransferase
MLDLPQRLQTHRLCALPDSIWLYFGPVDRQRGQILGKLTAAPEHEDLQALEKEVGRKFGVVCIVVNVALLDQGLYGQGYGVQLYAALAREAADKFDAPIISSTCLSQDISADAERTWNSTRLAQQLVVRGKAAWGGPT